MKRIIFLLVAFLLFAGCAQQAYLILPETPEAAVQESAREPLQVVTTIFPQFDFIRQIAGDRVELTMLISPGAESHSFEPTPRDMVTLHNADLLIYVGGHSETWVHPVLNSLEREDMRTVAILGLIDDLLEVHYDHSNHHHDHDNHHHDHSNHHHDYSNHHHDHEIHLDEHIWTSPQNAALIIEALAEVLSEMDPTNSYFYRENAAAYIQEIMDLDQAFADVVAQGIRNTIVFGDRFPFRYLAHAYNLTYYAAFDGCSSETQASPARVAFLIEKVQNENIPVVFYIEFSDRAIANVIEEATGARLLKLHSIHNVSHSDFTAGVTYLELMLQNLEQLRKALS